jgi:hypothetical protein
MRLKRRFPADGFGAASVFETFVEHRIALGMPFEMLMVEERSRDRLGAIIWIRLPASEYAAYWEFGEAPETALPKAAILLIGHNGEFEKLFYDAEDATNWFHPTATDICRAPKLIIDWHGNDAAIYAALDCGSRWCGRRRGRCRLASDHCGGRGAATGEDGQTKR